MFEPIRPMTLLNAYITSKQNTKLKTTRLFIATNSRSINIPGEAKLLPFLLFSEYYQLGIHARAYKKVPIPASMGVKS